MEHTNTDTPVELHSSLVQAQKKEKKHRTNCHARATLFDLHTAGKCSERSWKRGWRKSSAGKEGSCTRLQVFFCRCHESLRTVSEVVLF